MPQLASLGDPSKKSPPVYACARRSADQLYIAAWGFYGTGTSTGVAEEPAAVCSRHHQPAQIAATRQPHPSCRVSAEHELSIHTAGGRAPTAAFLAYPACTCRGLQGVAVGSSLWSVPTRNTRTHLVAVWQAARLPVYSSTGLLLLWDLTTFSPLLPQRDRHLHQIRSLSLCLSPPLVFKPV